MYTCIHTYACHRYAYSTHITHREEKVRKGGKRMDINTALPSTRLLGPQGESESA